MINDYVLSYDHLAIFQIFWLNTQVVIIELKTFGQYHSHET